ncbi:UbiA family prenyltransferase [Actinotalea sp. BY-33]|uniref:UbiA family prenyltransferase n=1 Tax=Actinotalea soli TaxID=2819234 RepID=A0A939LMF7_9CELL|nr:UbiA family prenyltransferase [Actinotalea soli]MBO1750522.1 UbiA family prenyltransferase [Actinotalea soli]
MPAHQRVRGLLLASHAGPTAVVTCLAAALLLALDAPAATAATATAAVLAGQLSIGWSNDAVDADRDLAVARRDKPVVRGSVTPRLLRAAAVVALGVCVVLSLLTGIRSGGVHVLAVAGGWAYNLGLKATIWSWLPYVVSFGLLPAFLVLALPGQAGPSSWVVAVGGLLGLGAHLANVLPDLHDDAATGIRGLPHRLGRRATSVLAPVVLLAAAALVVLAPRGPVGALEVLALVAAGVLSVAAGVVAVLRERSRLPFTVTMAVAVICVALLVAAGPDLLAR